MNDFKWLVNFIREHGTIVLPSDPPPEICVTRYSYFSHLVLVPYIERYTLKEVEKHAESKGSELGVHITEWGCTHIYAI